MSRKFKEKGEKIAKKIGRNSSTGRRLVWKEVSLKSLFKSLQNHEVKRLVRFIKLLVIYFKLHVGLTSNYFLFMDLLIVIALDFNHFLHTCTSRQITV